MTELQSLLETGVFDPIDVTFAEAMRRLAPEADPHVIMAAALASRAVQRGHVCLDLATVAGLPLVDDDGRAVDTPLPSLATFLGALEQSELVGDGTTLAPLVLSAGRLYLARYYGYEGRLAAALMARAQRHVDVDDSHLRDGLARLFAGAAPGDEQRRAAALANLRRLAIISGGPGTGKTTTVAKILILLQEQALASTGTPLRILLAAPTGKAAQRLGESIGASIDELDTRPEVRAAVPRTASTLHRTLGYRSRTPTRFTYGRDRPLDADVVLADEASMIDLALMTKLVEAVPQQGRLILLGDKDQLVSVEAGAIFGDLYGRAAGYSPDLAAQLERLTGDETVPVAQEAGPLDDCTAQLSRSYRYGEDSGIGALARAINRGDADRTMDVLRGDRTMPYGEVAITPVDPQNPLGGHGPGGLGRIVLDGYRGCLEDRPLDARLEALARFRVLCAHRRGPGGVELLNLAIAQHLRRAGLLARATGPYFHGRPVIITRNDYQLELFNGDIGLMVREDDRMMVAFSTAAGIRRLPAARLPAHETVFAMTVHKSQGSEFDRLALVMPPASSPILTRELVYTAVTRARRRVDIFGDEAVLRAAVRTRVSRTSGLAHRW